MQRRALAVWLIVFAFAARAFIPGGYMPQSMGSHVVMAACTATGPLMMVVDPPATPKNRSGEDAPVRPAACSYTALNTPSLAGVDPVLLQVAIAFIIATSFFWAPLRNRNVAPRLRPPLRGPPLVSKLA